MQVQLTEAMTPGHESIKVVVYRWRELPAIWEPTDEVIIVRALQLSGMCADAGAIGWCVRDEKTGLWYLAQVECPAELVES